MTESSSPPDARFVEELGFYNPTKSPAIVKIEEEKALAWLEKGATPSDTVRSLFSQAGLIAKFEAAKRKYPRRPARGAEEARTMKELVEILVRSLVDTPEQVAITAVEGPRSLTINVRVADSDMGKVIGRQGRVAKAIRTLVKAAAVKDGRRINVEFSA